MTVEDKEPGMPRIWKAIIIIVILFFVLWLAKWVMENECDKHPGVMSWHVLLLSTCAVLLGGSLIDALKSSNDVAAVVAANKPDNKKSNRSQVIIAHVWGWSTLGINFLIPLLTLGDTGATIIGIILGNLVLIILVVKLHDAYEDKTANELESNATSQSHDNNDSEAKIFDKHSDGNEPETVVANEYPNDAKKDRKRREFWD